MTSAGSSPRRRVPPLGDPAWIAFAGGLPPSMADDPAVVAYSRRTRRWRTAAVVTAVAMSFLLGRSTGGWAVIAALGVGWFLGGLLPELFVRHRNPTAVRVAGLDDRRPGRYLMPTARRWLIGSYAVAGAMAAITPVAGLSFTPRHLIGAAIVVVVSVTGVVAVRRIAMRSQPAGDAVDLAIDDAIRNLATTRAVAGWAALQFVAVFVLVPQGLTLDSPLPATSSIYLMYASYVGIIACWAWVPTRATPQRPIAPAGIA